MWQACLLILAKLISSIGTRPKLAVLVVVTIATTLAGVFVLVPRTYSTEAGEWRTVTLTDSTVVRLGPRTRIIVSFDTEKRLIRQVGNEATYQVAKDPNRPLFVKAGVATVQAIGTKFGVSSDSETIVVTVAEGIVSVSRHSARPDHLSPPDSVRAEAGQQVLVDLWTPLSAQQVNVDVALAWERGRIVFQGTPIPEAISQYNRRHKRQIPIPPRSSHSSLVFGEFDLENPDKFIEYLEKMTGPN